MILPSRQHVTAFAAFSLPFWLLYLSDLMIGRRDYDMFAAETFGIIGSFVILPPIIFTSSLFKKSAYANLQMKRTSCE